MSEAWSAESLITSVESQVESGAHMMVFHTVMPPKLPPAVPIAVKDGVHLMMGDVTNLDKTVSRDIESGMIAVPFLTRSAVMQAVKYLNFSYPYGSMYIMTPAPDAAASISKRIDRGVSPVIPGSLLSLNNYTHINFVDLPYYPEREDGRSKWRDAMVSVYSEACKAARSLDLDTIVFPVIPSKGTPPRDLLGKIALEALVKEAATPGLKIVLVFSHQASYAGLEISV